MRAAGPSAKSKTATIPLDNEKSFEKALEKARDNGTPIVIGYDYPLTKLYDNFRDFVKSGRVLFVTLSPEDKGAKKLRICREGMKRKGEDGADGNTVARELDQYRRRSNGEDTDHRRRTTSGNTGYHEIMKFGGRIKTKLEEEASSV